MADTDAATTTTAPATGTAPPAHPSSYETLSEDDAIIEAMRAEVAAGTLAPGNDAEEETPEVPADEAEDDKKKKKGKKSKGEKEPKSKPAPPTYATVEDALTAITKALEKGDLDALAKATGKPRNFFDDNRHKWADFREKTDQLRESQKALAKRQKDYDVAVEKVRTDFGPAIAAAKAYRNGDYEAFVGLVQTLTGDAYDDAQRKVIEGAIAVDPNTKSLRKKIADLEKRLVEKEAAREQQTQEQTQQQAYDKVIGAVTDELAGHPVAKIKGFQKLILEKVRESYDEDERAYTMSFREAAQAVLDDRDSELEAQGYHRVESPKRAAPKSGIVPPRARSADARTPDGEPWETGDLDDDAIIESIKRDVRAGRLKA